MRLLLDTHSFLWFIEGNSKLSPTARHLIEDANNKRLLSVGSLWEIAIKASMGRLKLALSIPDLVQREVYGNAISLLRIEPTHLDTLMQLPFHHKDPFDQLIIAQSLSEAVPVVGTDTSFKRYSLNLLW